MDQKKRIVFDDLKITFKPPASGDYAICWNSGIFVKRVEVKGPMVYDFQLEDTFLNTTSAEHDQVNKVESTTLSAPNSVNQVTVDALTYNYNCVAGESCMLTDLPEGIHDGNRLRLIRKRV